MNQGKNRGKLSLQERWVQAMCKGAYSLIGYNGYAEEDATFLCNCFIKSAPKHPKLEVVIALENETKDLSSPTMKQNITKKPFTKKDSLAILKATTKPVRESIENNTKLAVKDTLPNPDDFQRPW